MKFQSIRGTKDMLPAFALGAAAGGPSDAEAAQRLESGAREVFRRFGFHEIRTPTFEALELFQRSLGETTDVVQKEMYAFEDRGGRKLALRPEGTAGVVRAFIEHHLSQTAPFCKLFYIGAMFRAERPQAGRYREFWQVGAEAFGNAAPAADAEMLLMLQSLFEALGLQNIVLKINSLGDSACRPQYLEALKIYLQSKASSLCDDCQRRIDKNPLRALDCKVDGQKLLDAPLIDHFWCEPCRAHFDRVKTYLDESRGRYEVVPRLVRGLDYYSRTVFEVTSSDLGAQDALAAGGRYDKLVKNLGGPDVPAIGFAMGLERALEAIKKSGSVSGPEPRHKVFVWVAAMGERPSAKAFGVLQALRREGVSADGGFFEKKLGAQLQIADKIGATHCVIIGDDEVSKDAATVRSLKTSTQESVDFSKLSGYFQTLLNA